MAIAIGPQSPSAASAQNPDGALTKKSYDLRASVNPRPVLGLPPDWYKAKPCRARAVYEPRKVLAEFGTIIPDEVEIRVSDSTAIQRYLVLPMRPDGTEGMTEEQLASLVTRDAMIGVIQVKSPLEGAEPRRVCRRLQLLRKWSHYEQDNEQVFT